MTDKLRKINILVLAAAETESPGISCNRPPVLIEVGGKSVLEIIMENCSGIGKSTFRFAYLKQDIQRYHLDSITNLVCENSQCIAISNKTMGSACTALLSVCDMDPEEELLVISANELVNVDLNEAIQSFRSGNTSAGVLVFKSINPNYSYVRLDSLGKIVEAAQRRPISNIATTGTFWFSKTGDFIRCVKSMILNGESVDGLFYIAPVLNELILEHKNVGYYQIPNHAYQPLKSLRQVEKFENGSI